MKRSRILVFERGGPETQKVSSATRIRRMPGRRIRGLTVTVTLPGASVWRGEALYTGNVLVQYLPYTPGYAVIGEVDALGTIVCEAANANALLESETMIGNVVLAAPGLP